jgi:hypothetical protein
VVKSNSDNGNSAVDDKRHWHWPWQRVQTFELVEIRHLSKLVVERMDELQPDAKERHGAWVAAEFRYPLRSLLIKAAANSALFTAVSLVVVAGGFATSGITAAVGSSKSSVATWVVFAIGLLVALAGALAQLFRFGVKANERRTLAVTLREEGWNFVYEVGDFADDASALGKFRTRVDEIQRRIADVASIEADSTRRGNSGASADDGSDEDGAANLPPKKSAATVPGASPQTPDEPAVATGDSG